MALTSTRNTHGTNVPWVSGSLALALVGLQLIAPVVFEHFVYDRAAILDGQAWRLITGHLVHLDWSHLAANVAALLCLGWAIETGSGDGRTNLMAVLGTGATLVSLTMVLFNPATAFYAGLSGALNGLLAFVCLQFYAQTRAWIWPVLLVADIAKIAWESVSGPIFTTTIAWPPEPVAHIAGLLAGACVFAVRFVNLARRSWYFPWAACPFNPV